MNRKLGKSVPVVSTVATLGCAVDPQVLINALQSGRLRAAGLDVLEQEPPDPDNPILRMDNVVLSPHNGGEDTLSSLNMGIEAAECILKLYRSEWPEGCAVNNELRDGWKW